MSAFVFNDETQQNSHGFFLLNAGGRFERFRNNPVMLHNHDTNLHTGKWNNLRIEGSLLLADPEFDEQDPDAAKIKGKVDRGYLRGASPGIRILAAEFRENPVTKEMDLYVTDWELYEGSTATIPSNSGAITLKIYDDNNHQVEEDKIRLHVENIVKLSLSDKQKKIQTPKEKPMAEIKLTAGAITALGITEDADGTAISSAIVSLKSKADDAERNYNTLKEKVDKEKEEKVKKMVDLAIEEQRIVADRRESIIKLGLADYEGTKAMLDAIPARTPLSAQIQSSVTGKTQIPDERKTWNLHAWMKNDMAGLQKLKAEDAETYQVILKKK